jgi:hypothetical protein
MPSTEDTRQCAQAPRNGWDRRHTQMRPGDAECLVQKTHANAPRRRGMAGTEDTRKCVQAPNSSQHSCETLESTVDHQIEVGAF